MKKICVGDIVEMIVDGTEIPDRGVVRYIGVLDNDGEPDSIWSDWLWDADYIGIPMDFSFDGLTWVPRSSVRVIIPMHTKDYREFIRKDVGDGVFEG